MKRALTAVGFAALAACTVGPKYQPPQVAAPPAFKSLDGWKTAEGWKTAQPADHVDRKSWWEVFRDEELNSLASQVAASNQTLKAAEARLRQSRAMVRVHRASRYPAIGVSPAVGGMRPTNNRPGFPASLAAESSASLSWPSDLSYELDLWGRVRRTVEAGRDEAQASAADMQTARLSLQADLASHYFQMRAAEAQQKLLTLTVAAFEDMVKLTNNRFEGGVAPKTDVAQARAQLEAARADLTDIGIDRAQREHAIAVLTGKAPAELTIPVTGVLNPPPTVPVGLPSELLERRPDIAAMERRAAAANEQIGIAHAAFYPTVRFGASGGFTGTTMANWFSWPSRLWSIGPNAALPLFDAGRRTALTASAEAGYDAIVAEYRQTALTAFQQVEDTVAALRTLEIEEQQQQLALEAARESVQLATNRYQGGVDTYIQVLTAQTVALQNERRMIDIRLRRLTASVALIKALGGGWDVSEIARSKTD